MIYDEKKFEGQIDHEKILGLEQTGQLQLQMK